MLKINSQITECIEKLGWDPADEITVEIGGTQIYEIEGAGTKWAPKKGTQNYNKDAFIVIKNQNRRDNTKSVPNLSQK
tara:strand:+ start:1712 stop:1945 length:234 start_codon:yes stop_codon:yes gene_type:complete